MDTGITTANSEGYYHAIRNVKELNSSENEFMISYLDGNTAYTHENSQRQIYTDLERNGRYLFKKREKISNGELHIGFPADHSRLTNKTVFSTALLPDLIKSDLPRERFSTNKMFGLSFLGLGSYIGNSIETDRSFADFTEYDWMGHFGEGPNGILMFASDMEGGYGGTDIWYCEVEGGDIGEPINMGPNVNTPCNELSPFYNDLENRVYFSSMGHESVGGYDIFYSEVGSGGSIGSAINFGKPINTEHDEIFPSTNMKSDRLFTYSSNKPGGKGGFDLYMLYYASEKDMDFAYDPEVEIEIPEPEEEKKVQQDIEKLPPIKDKELEKPLEFELKGKVKDEVGEPVEGATVTKKDLAGGKAEKVKTDSKGEFNIDVKTVDGISVRAESDNTLYAEKKLEREELVGASTVNINLVLPKILNLRLNFPNDNSTDPYKYVLDDDGRKTNRTWEDEVEAAAEHILNFENIIDEVVLTGHTSTKGSDEYNKQLGLRRAKFLKEKLVESGVPESLIKTVSKGESQVLERRSGEVQETYDARLRRVTLTKVLKKEAGR
ncbi:MAG: hypothetical protein Kapaf2KO_21210 [Candidatus Kapaibacteriales bacterium]